MSDTVTLSSKGQLVIPKSLRDSAHLAAGAVLSVRYVDGEIRLKPLANRDHSSLDQVAGCLAQPGRQRLSDEATEAAIKARLKTRDTRR
jgi:AbrB family looped-hinge helix DNA binding protein